MSNDDIIEMARQCGHWNGQTCEMNDVGLEAFAKLVAAKERERIYFETSTDFVKSAVAAEREACAKVCEQYSDTDTYQGGITTEFHAIMIRKRGEA